MTSFLNGFKKKNIRFETFCDASKAFERVWIRGLIYKLEKKPTVQTAKNKYIATLMKRKPSLRFCKCEKLTVLQRPLVLCDVAA